MTIKSFLFCVLALSSYCLHAQVPVANFSATPLTGCAPLVVAFTDQSSGTPTEWNWDFGNGQLSNAKSPVVTYSQPGTYSVTLVVKNANGTHGVTKTNLIKVNASPGVAFTASITTACVPATIQFTDQSSDASGSIVSWEWDFGDGTKSTQQNPQKVYATTGFYSVSLTVTSSTGCKAGGTKNRYIRMVAGVKADFSNAITASCQAPFNATFENQTSGPGTLSYFWDFGNGNTSTQQHPTTTFNTAGTYNIKLVATSEFGCSNTIDKSVQIRTSTTTIGGSDTVCINKPLSLINGANPAPASAVWDFGDGTGSTSINPTKTYSTAGQYTVTLTNNFGYCRDVVTKTITVVDAPVVNFTSSATTGCKAPSSISFQDNSPNAVSWLWDFGDGTTSTQKDPTHTYNSFGTFSVRLTITTSFGCSNTIRKDSLIKIEKSTLSVQNVPGQGCIPFSYSPVASINSIEPVVSYLWDFGDGATSTLQNPTHIYNAVGTYTLKLAITTASGCSETLTIPNAVSTGTPPVVNFTFDKTDVCASDAVNFQGTATPTNVTWLWDFGDETSSSLQNPSHIFKDTGNLSVSLTALSNGCGSTISKVVKIRPPVARFSFNVPNCANRFLIGFLNESLVDPNQPVTYAWNFGDGSPVSNAVSPTHLYSALGTYNVSLVVTNGSCSYRFDEQVRVIQETATFTTTKASVCTNERFTLNAGGTAANIALYQYSINGGPLFGASRSFDTSISVPGTYSIALTITDISGCKDTKVIANMITVTGPTPDFGLATPGACENRAVTFTDQSTSTNPIVKWEWDFGDTSVQSFSTGPFTHIYKDIGVYTVKLTTTDNKGCSSVITKPNFVVVSRSVADFSADTLSCQGAAVKFLDASSGNNLSYAWDFGDGNTSTLQSPSHVYSGPDSTYSISLAVTDASGCVDTLKKLSYIKIKRPKPAFTAVDTVSICPPLETKFTFLGQDYESYYWDFGDDSKSTQLSPSHFYNDYGVYRPKLVLVGYGGCLDSVSQTVNVYNPGDVQINYSPLDACNQLAVDFSIISPPNTTFNFYYGDGKMDTSQQKQFQYLYNSPNFYYPELHLMDKLNCIIPIAGRNTIKILGALPNFAKDRKEFCDTGVVTFTNYTIANDPIVSQVWDFDDGTTTTDLHPVHNFVGGDSYEVKLTVTTQAGCVKDIIDTIRVYTTPDVGIFSDDLVCINTPILFQGTLVKPDTLITWRWNFGNGQSSATQQLPVVYNQAGTFNVSLEAANKLGCKDTISKRVVVAPLPVITMGPDPVIPVGTGIRLPVSYGPLTRIYNWTPTRNLDCPTCPVPFANPKFTTRYQVSVTDSNGCVASSQVTVNVVCNDKNYFVPNTFSPNGDGVNDIFYPRGSSIDRIQSVRIFNRWGQLVFEKRNTMANNMADGWNGTYKGQPALPDTYVFIIEYICDNAEIIPVKGNVTLVR